MYRNSQIPYLKANSIFRKSFVLCYIGINVANNWTQIRLEQSNHGSSYCFHLSAFDIYINIYT